MAHKAIVVAIGVDKVNPNAIIVWAIVLHNDNKLCATVHCVIGYVVGLCHLFAPLLMFDEVGAKAPFYQFPQFAFSWPSQMILANLASLPFCEPGHEQQAKRNPPEKITPRCALPLLLRKVTFLPSSLMSVSVWLHRSALLMAIGVNEASACVNIFFATLICLKRMAKLG